MFSHKGEDMEEIRHIKPDEEAMQSYIPDKQGHVPVAGHNAVYPQDHKVFFLHGEFAGMEPLSVEQDETPVQAEEPKQTRKAGSK